jgi:hypothetical protein
LKSKTGGTRTAQATAITIQNGQVPWLFCENLRIIQIEVIAKTGFVISHST